MRRSEVSGLCDHFGRPIKKTSFESWRLDKRGWEVLLLRNLASIVVALWKKPSLESSVYLVIILVVV